MHLKILSFLTLTAFPIFSSAADIQYDIKAYGEKIAVIALSGGGSSNLIVTPSDEGRIVTISGANTSFVPLRTTALPSMFKGLRSFSHGLTTELILEFNSTTQVTATPSPTSLQIMIKASSTEQPSGTKQKNNGSGLGGETHLVIPAPRDFVGTTWLSTSLRIAATVIDASWAFLNGRTFSFEVKKESSIEKRALEDHNNKDELESLVSQLNKEIIDLRNELKKK